MKFYNLKRILSYKSTYNVIIGERSNGKTYSVLEEGIKEFFSGNGQLGIIRRWKEDIRGQRGSAMFNAHIKNGLIKKYSNGLYSGLHFYAGKFTPCNYDKKTGRAVYKENNVLAYAFALSDAEHNKSNSFPDITLICFDEFLSNQIYLQNEFILFMSTISTIIRQRVDVKIFMLGNTVSKYCPYFSEMGLNNILKMKQGEIDTYKYGKSSLTVTVEYCTSLKEFKKNNHFFAFNNPKLEMITSGAWELNKYPHLSHKYTKKNIILTYFIDFNLVIYQCEIIEVNNLIFTYIHNKTTDLKDVESDLIYCLEANALINYNSNLLKPINKMQKRVLWFFNNNRIFYQNNEIGDAINNFIKQCINKR